MGRLVPSLEEIESLPQALMPGERTLMEALRNALSDDWTIYVQPHLNGLRPDIVIYNEDAGIGIFEVKDWNLTAHRIIDKLWQVRDASTGEWVTLKSQDLPLQQAQKYKDSLIKYEMPILDSYRALDESIYSLVVPFVYFHCHTTAEVEAKLAPLLSPYTNVFGHDSLHPSAIQAMLHRRHLKGGSKFGRWMKQAQLKERLESALAYPSHGATDVAHLLVKFRGKQKDLLLNAPGMKRVLGAAGSGKTLLLIHKAVEAAMAGERVLLVCFNITMSNYLRDLVTRLARYYGSHHHRLIEVAHFHRLFPDEQNTVEDCRYMKEPVQVLLIDEGQDFEREWFDTLFSICSSKRHVFLVEDDRQNIYGRDMASRRSIPGIRGRPNLLNESFRIPAPIAALANAVISCSAMVSESEPVQSAKVVQSSLLSRTKWVESGGDLGSALGAIRASISHLGGVARPDVAILTCTAADGWEVLELLDELRLPYQRTFETRKEHDTLYERYQDPALRYDENPAFKRRLHELRRAYKAGFWMQGGKIKVSTIHSFKGWELSQIHVLFRAEGLEERGVPLLYTAITRAQERLAIYNVDERFTALGQMINAMGLIDEYEVVGEVPF
jgi:hypothetical protein